MELHYPMSQFLINGALFIVYLQFAILKVADREYKNMSIKFDEFNS